MINQNVHVLLIKCCMSVQNMLQSTLLVLLLSKLLCRRAAETDIVIKPAINQMTFHCQLQDNGILMLMVIVERTMPLLSSMLGYLNQISLTLECLIRSVAYVIDSQIFATAICHLSIQVQCVIIPH